MWASFTNPWWVVVGAVGRLVVCNGSVLGFTFGVFLKPTMARHGWQRGAASLALSVGGICSGPDGAGARPNDGRWSIRRVALPALYFTPPPCPSWGSVRDLWWFSVCCSRSPRRPARFKPR